MKNYTIQNPKFKTVEFDYKSQKSLDLALEKRKELFKKGFILIGGSLGKWNFELINY